MGSSASSGSAPNRPLPPTPDDDESQGDRTLVLRKVSGAVIFLRFFFAYDIDVVFVITLCRTGFISMGV